MSSNDTSADLSLAYGEHAFDCHHCGKSIDLREHNNRAPSYCPHCGGSLLTAADVPFAMDPAGGNTDELKSPIGAQVMLESGGQSVDEHNVALSASLGIKLTEEQPTKPADDVVVKQSPTASYRRAAIGVGPAVSGGGQPGATTPSMEAVPEDASPFSDDEIEMPWDVDDAPLPADASVNVGAFDEGLIPRANAATAELDEEDIVDLEGTLQKLRQFEDRSPAADDPIELPFEAPESLSQPPHNVTAAHGPVVMSPHRTPVPGVGDFLAHMADHEKTEPYPPPLTPERLARRGAAKPPPPPRSVDSLAAPPLGGEEPEAPKVSAPELAALIEKVTQLSETVERRLQVLHKGNSALNAKVESLEAQLRAKGILDAAGAAAAPSLDLGLPPSPSPQPAGLPKLVQEPPREQTLAPPYMAHEPQEQFDSSAPEFGRSKRSALWLPIVVLLAVVGCFCVFVLPGLLPKASVSKPGSRRVVARAQALPQLPPTRSAVGASSDAGDGQDIPAIPTPAIPTRAVEPPPEVRARRVVPRRVVRRRVVRRRVVRRRVAPRPTRRRLRSRPKPRRLVPRPVSPPRRIKVVIVPSPPRPRVASFSLPKIAMSLPLARRCDVCARKLYASTFRKLSRSQQLKYFQLCNKACDKNWPLFQKRFYHWCKFRSLGDSSKCAAALKRKQPLYQYQIWLYP